MESIFIVVSIAIFHDLEIFKIDITSAYLNTLLILSKQLRPQVLELGSSSCFGKHMRDELLRGDIE